MERSYRDLLKEVFEQRKKQDPSYTILKYSQDAGFVSYHMSDILRGRYGLSRPAALKLVENLKFSHLAKEEFLARVELETGKSPHEKALALEKLENINRLADHSVCIDDYSFTSEWYYLAIIELARREDFKNDPQWLSERLGLSLETAELALEKLLSTKILNLENDRITVNFELFGVKAKGPSELIRKIHRSMIGKSLEAMESVPVEQRTFSSFNVLLSEEEYNSFKEDVLAFVRKSILLRQKQQKSDSKLYSINLQIFPLEQNTGGNQE